MGTNLSAEPFVDEVDIEVVAGRGGDGVVHFRREKYVPRGGPDGGDGGRGGDVIFVASPHVNTLYGFRGKRHLRAGHGRPGGGQRSSGRSGEDCVVDVPVGTIVFDADTGEIIADLDKPGVRVVVAEGGRGGLGNWHFRSSVNQAPRRATEGGEGEVRHLHLELRLLADVALVGYPNAGKSSLIRVLSRARPRVADYPFTTLVPNLGVVPGDDGGHFVIADVPGLIEGAADGAGLGHQFLKHVARCRVIAHILDLAEAPDLDSLEQRYAAIRHELERAPQRIDDRPEIVVINKIDLVPADETRQLAQELEQRIGRKVCATSTVTHAGLDVVRKTLLNALEQHDSADASEEDSAAPSAADRIWADA
ncbi:MAG: GTPase ObgE [Candidatus Dadabacteria bacterium]|nr:MAG: GTPase ObgE [Candidatus Dadabacteria bacterium]